MTITQIEVFVCLAKTNSFTRAGEILGMTQSAVSHAIFNLEKDLGVKLFERIKNGAVLTSIGEIIYVRMKEVLNGINMIYNDVRPIKNIPAGCIRVGTFPSTATSIMPKVMRIFAQDFPQIDIVLFEGTDQEILQWVENEIVDIGFITLPNNKHNSIFILQDELCAILPEKHKLANSKSIMLRDLHTDPFIMSKGGCEPLIREVMEKENVTLNIRHEVNNIYTIIEMVKENIGVTLMPNLALSTIVPDGFVLCSLKPRVLRTLALASKKNIEEDLLLDLFVEKAKLVALTYS